MDLIRARVYFGTCLGVSLVTFGFGTILHEYALLAIAVGWALTGVLLLVITGEHAETRSRYGNTKVSVRTAASWVMIRDTDLKRVADSAGVKVFDERGVGSSSEPKTFGPLIDVDFLKEDDMN